MRFRIQQRSQMMVLLLCTLKPKATMSWFLFLRPSTNFMRPWIRPTNCLRSWIWRFSIFLSVIALHSKTESNDVSISLSAFEESHASLNSTNESHAFLNLTMFDFSWCYCFALESESNWFLIAVKRRRLISLWSQSRTLWHTGISDSAIVVVLTALHIKPESGVFTVLHIKSESRCITFWYDIIQWHD